jgi:hypothetical protein
MEKKMFVQRRTLGFEIPQLVTRWLSQTRAQERAKNSLSFEHLSTVDIKHERLLPQYFDVANQSLDSKASLGDCIHPHDFTC